MLLLLLLLLTKITTPYFLPIHVWVESVEWKTLCGMSDSNSLLLILLYFVCLHRFSSFAFVSSSSSSISSYLIFSVQCSSWLVYGPLSAYSQEFLRNLFRIDFLLLFVVSNIVSPYNEQTTKIVHMLRKRRPAIKTTAMAMMATRRLLTKTLSFKVYLWTKIYANDNDNDNGNTIMPLEFNNCLCMCMGKWHFLQRLL